MAQVSPLMLARFTRLPRRSADTWQGGVLRMPTGVLAVDGMVSIDPPNLAWMASFYAQGVAAGERVLGPTTFDEGAGHFWADVRTRPYMRARFGLARCLEDLGQRDEALTHYRE